MELTDGISFGAYGYVPALSFNGAMISESMAILELIEDTFANFPLLPKDAIERARIREVCEYVNSTIHPAQNRTTLSILRSNLGESEKKKIRARWIEKGLQTLKPRLFCASGFAIGNAFSLADIFVAVMYQKGLNQGAHKDNSYEEHWSKMLKINGHEVDF